MGFGNARCGHFNFLLTTMRGCKTGGAGVFFQSGNKVEVFGGTKIHAF